LCPLFSFIKAGHYFKRRRQSGYGKLNKIKIKTNMKIAIIILSDPKAGEEALGRALNALATAHEALQSGDEVEVVFNGAGTRWPEELTKISHPANGLYNTVRETVKGASCACAAIFGATKSVEACGLLLIKDQALPGTLGAANIRRYVAEGWQTLIF
jgi:predicted peroxiredoxin